MSNTTHKNDDRCGVVLLNEPWFPKTDPAVNRLATASTNCPPASTLLVLLGYYKRTNIARLYDDILNNRNICSRNICHSGHINCITWQQLLINIVGDGFSRPLFDGSAGRREGRQPRPASRTIHYWPDAIYGTVYSRPVPGREKYWSLRRNLFVWKRHN